MGKWRGTGSVEHSLQTAGRGAVPRRPQAWLWELDTCPPVGALSDDDQGATQRCHAMAACKPRARIHGTRQGGCCGEPSKMGDRSSTGVDCGVVHQHQEGPSRSDSSTPPCLSTRTPSAVEAWILDGPRPPSCSVSRSVRLGSRFAVPQYSGWHVNEKGERCNALTCVRGQDRRTERPLPGMCVPFGLGGSNASCEGEFRPTTQGGINR